MYWQRLGNLPYKLALQKVCGGNATALDSLCSEDVIKVIDGNICIDFLNEQLSGFENTSKTNSENARSGWLKRNKNATAMRPHSDPNAIREEERRGERENIHTHGKGKIQITIKRQYAGDKIHRIHDLKEYFTYSKQLESLGESGWVHFDAFMKANSGAVFNEPGHLYNSFRNFCNEYKPPPKVDKFKDAEFEKTLLTLEAWEQTFAYKLKHDTEFRKHFGYGELSLSKSMGQ